MRRDVALFYLDDGIGISVYSHFYCDEECVHFINITSSCILIHVFSLIVNMKNM